MAFTEFNNIPNGYGLCIHTDCPLASHCLRAIAMRLLPNEERKHSDIPGTDGTILQY